MAYVQSSRCKKYELLTAYGEEPTIHIESEGERLIRDLSVKQLDTSLTFEKLKKQEKEFERGTGFVPLSVHSGGSSTLQELKEKVIREEKLEKLHILGLTNKEANAVLNNEDLTFPDSKIEISVKNARAEQIKKIIKGSSDNLLSKQEEKDFISRHEKELALAVKPESTETKLLQFALSCQKNQNFDKDIRPPGHPINHLQELEKELFRDYNPHQLANTVKRKRYQLLEASLSPYGPKFLKKSDNETKASLWDQEVDRSDIKNAKTEIKVAKPYSCKKQTFYTIKDGKIVEIDKLKKGETNKNNDEIKNNCSPTLGTPFVNISQSNNTDFSEKQLTKLSMRLSEEEIKKLPHFTNYKKGIRSKVLYIKNLSSGVKEDDLVELLKRFQRSDLPCLIYRLMSGKMHGQAFVTFPNEDIAEEALNSVNGTIVKGRPLVIQFGKS
ncbi:RNA-binding protein 41-like [Lycorma delicatula]|uniref:RNA-binding protein 41-like n=1 Tax=Lycorma delicatula TaxID=130591 RepID=UPI003F5192AA